MTLTLPSNPDPNQVSRPLGAEQADIPRSYVQAGGSVE